MKFASYSIHFTAAGVLTLCGILFFAAPATAEDIENKALTTETNAVPESKAAPEKTDWAQAAHQSTESLLKHFWNSTGRYFNAESLDSTHFNYWPQAHAMDVVIDAWLRTRDSKYSDYFSPWYEGIREKIGGRYWIVFFDDMEWIALTLLRLHDATGEEKYLNTARASGASSRKAGTMRPAESPGRATTSGAKTPAPTARPASSPADSTESAATKKTSIGQKNLCLGTRTPL
jgi:hypothetical protein